MSDDFISRWSRRKIEARKGEVAEEKEPVVPAPEAAAPLQVEEAPEPLPPISSLTPESDFTPFMKAEVDPQLKRDALKALFKDPRYNVMDGLDVYIDDYSKPDPLPEGWLEQMTQFARLGEYKPPVETPPESAPPSGAPEAEVVAEQGVAPPIEPHPDGAQEDPPPPSGSKQS